ncbi:MAG: insulinase family protein [Ignavibacteria bacterium]
MKSLMLFVTSFCFSMGVAMTAFTQDLDRTIKPRAQGAPAIKLPAIQKATLNNGLSVWLVEDHELPLVAFNLVVSSGSDHDPLDQPGLASMTAEMLDEGTSSRTALQIAEALDFIGATLSVNAFTDGSTVALNTLTKHLDTALDVFADVLVNPTFPEKEFERLRQQRLTSLLQQKDRPAAIASLTFYKLLYGTKHPYGLNPSGTEASLKAMKRDDVAQFHQKYYRPNNATLIVVGDVSMGDIVAKLEHLLASWKRADVSRVILPPPPLSFRQAVLIDKPGAPQSEVRIGSIGAARNTPDFFPLTVMNTVLGGQFSSRLNMNLRERRGFTYGARSNFSFNKYPGPFLASAAVTTSKTDSAVFEFFYEIERMQRLGITPEELEFAKKSLTGSFARTFETPTQIASALQSIVLYNLPMDYFNSYLQKINNVTLDDVSRVAADYLDSSRMVVVVVGDAKTIRSGLEKLNIGKLVMSDADGNRLTQ